MQEDVRWRYGTPPKGNANFAWVQHFVHHLSPKGRAGFVLANGSMSSNQSGEGDIRRALVEADMVECMVALPGQLFYSTQIPVCLWFLSRLKPVHRKKQTLFLDARKLGTMIDRVHRELSDEDIAHVAGTYHAWRGEMNTAQYEDTPGLCRSATTDEIGSQGFVLTPGRYVGAEDVDDDDEPFEEKMARLTAQLEEQFAESARLEKTIRRDLAELGGWWLERATTKQQQSRAWSFVWEALAKALRGGVSEERLRAIGRRWLKRYPNRRDWNFVWRRLVETATGDELWR